MNKILKSLYKQWCDTHKDTPEYDFAYDVFCKPGKDITLKQADFNADIFSDCVNAESEQAFCAGFQTAVQLLTGGVQS